MLSIEPGSSRVTPEPMMIEVLEPGGVRCTTRSSPPPSSTSSRQPRP
jgi:hypothetical protein